MDHNLRISLAGEMDDRDKARLRSMSGLGAGSWTQTIPTSDEFALSPSEFLLAICMRLGLALPTQNFVSNCDSRASLYPSGFHLLICKSGGGPVRMLNTVVSCWSACLRDLGIYHKVEPKFRYLANSDRPDISIFDAGTLANFDLDISMAHPWAKEVIKAGAYRNRGQRGPWPPSFDGRVTL